MMLYKVQKVVNFLIYKFANLNNRYFFTNFIDIENFSIKLLRFIKAPLYNNVTISIKIKNFNEN